MVYNIQGIVAFGSVGLTVKACSHWFPKQDTLYPETGHFVAVLATKSPISAYKVSCFIAKYTHNNHNHIDRDF